MKRQITRISILQTSKVMTAFYVLIGVFEALIFLGLSTMPGSQVRFPVPVILSFPIIFGIFGFIGFVIFSALYNLLAKWLGGMEFDVKDIG